MPTDLRILIEAAADRIEEGRRIKEDAAFGGHMTDLGGGAMISEGEAFIAGADGRLPEGWERHLNAAKSRRAEIEKRNDPE